MPQETLPDTLPPAAPQPAAGGTGGRATRLALPLIALTGLMLILDATITNVALPTVQRSLGMSAQALQWVVNAYTLAFGGFLLLGGRLADRLGRRRVFLAGMALFTLASFLGGLALSGGWLVAARALQGLGGAVTLPAALSILTVTFAEGPERNRALGVWSAVAASGGAVGLLLGGLLTQYVSWRWVLFVNVPVGALVVAATPRVLPEFPGEPRARTDVAGAVTVTAGLVTLVYATTQVPEHGWTSPRALGFLLAAAALLGAFLAVESRHPAPLVPLGIFRRRNLAGADAVSVLVGAGLMSSFFFLTLYLQQVLGYSAIQAGLASMPIAVGVLLSSQAASRLVNTVPPKALVVSGLTAAGLGLWLLGGIHATSTFTGSILLPSALIGLGMGMTFVPLTVSAVAGVAPADQGLASALLTTAQQLGGALGLAALATAATSRTEGLLGRAASPPDPAALAEALTSGYAAAIRGGALLALAGAALAALIIQGRRAARGPGAGRGPGAEPEPAACADAPR